jgi:hypothetical protein
MTGAGPGEVLSILRIGIGEAALSGRMDARSVRGAHKTRAGRVTGIFTTMGVVGKAIAIAFAVSLAPPCERR